MSFRIGSAGTLLLLLLVLSAEGLIAAGMTIAWTPSSAFVAGLIVGAYFMFACTVLWTESKTRLGWH